MSSPTRHDVAVVGAGPAGCATAIELRRLGVERVLVLDAGRRPFPVGESLPPDTRMLIERLGAWDAFAAAGHEPCPGSSSAWGSAELGYNDFIFSPHGPGWHLDRERFDRDLARRATAVGATLLHARVHDVERLSDRAFRLHDPDTAWEAACVVDATGSASSVSRSLGARRLVDDRLSCVVGFLRLPAGSEMSRRTTLEAVRDGWWYAARLPGDRAVALLASESEIITEHALHTEAAWRAAVDGTAHVATALTGAELIPGSLGMRTAPSAVSDPSGGDGWLAVGDAAAALDPLSSQGIHQALASGLDAAASVTAWLAGDPAQLNRYADSVQNRFAEYLAVREHMYALEDRWRHEPFWAARRARAQSRRSYSR